MAAAGCAVDGVVQQGWRLRFLPGDGQLTAGEPCLVMTKGWRREERSADVIGGLGESPHADEYEPEPGMRPAGDQWEVLAGLQGAAKGGFGCVEVSFGLADDADRAACAASACSRRR